MPTGLLQYISNHLPSIMTGLTMAVIGIGVYQARDGFFLFGQRFRGKFTALVIFLGGLVGVSLSTPMIAQKWREVLPTILPGQLLGIIIIMGMIGVNKEAEWNYLDPKSLLVYLLGGLLLLKPGLLNLIP